MAPHGNGMRPAGKLWRSCRDMTMVLSAAFGPDGKRIVTASADHTARVWGAETNEPVFPLQGHEGPVRSASFSRDGKLIVTASDDTAARSWSADTGDPIRVLRGHGREVRSAAFSPDDVRVVTGSIDRTARIWDTTTGETVAQLIGHKAPVQHSSFSADGLRVLTASSDGTLRIWSVFSTTQALIDQANRIVPQQLECPAQWMSNSTISEGGEPFGIRAASGRYDSLPKHPV